MKAKKSYTIKKEDAIALSKKSRGVDSDGKRILMPAPTVFKRKTDYCRRSAKRELRRAVAEY